MIDEKELICTNCSSNITMWVIHKNYYVPIRQCCECGTFFRIPKNDIYKKNPDDKRDINEVE